MLKLSERVLQIGVAIRQAGVRAASKLRFGKEAAGAGRKCLDTGRTLCAPKSIEVRGGA